MRGRPANRPSSGMCKWVNARRSRNHEVRCQRQPPRLPEAVPCRTGRCEELGFSTQSMLQLLHLAPAVLVDVLLLHLHKAACRGSCCNPSRPQRVRKCVVSTAAAQRSGSRPQREPWTTSAAAHGALAVQLPGKGLANPRRFWKARESVKVFAEDWCSVSGWMCARASRPWRLLSANISHPAGFSTGRSSWPCTSWPTGSLCTGLHQSSALHWPPPELRPNFF